MPAELAGSNSAQSERNYSSCQGNMGVIVEQLTTPCSKRDALGSQILQISSETMGRDCGVRAPLFKFANRSHQ